MKEYCGKAALKTIALYFFKSTYFYEISKIMKKYKCANAKSLEQSVSPRKLHPTSPTFYAQLLHTQIPKAQKY